MLNIVYADDYQKRICGHASELRRRWLEVYMLALQTSQKADQDWHNSKALYLVFTGT